MRIGLVIYGALDTQTGGYLYDRIVAAGLDRLGHRIEVISLQQGSYPQRFARGWFATSANRLEFDSFDIVLQDELCHPTLVGVNRRQRSLNGPPMVAIVHHTLSGEPRNRWLNRALAAVERSYLASVDGFIFNSESTRRSVEELVGCNTPFVVANPSGDRFGFPISPEQINMRSYLPGPLELLFLGSVISRKGLLPLLESLARIDPSIWRLTVAGGLHFEPAYAVQAQELLRRLGLCGSVSFLGQIEDDELFKLLQKTQVLCMPFAYEGFGIAILEAMAFGMPALCCRNGAACETVSEGVNGYLFSRSDQTRLEPLLMRLHQNRDELCRMSLAARESSMTRPGWQDAAPIIDRFLHALTSQTKEQRPYEHCP